MQTSKKNTLALCVLLKNSKDQGSIYINSKDLIKLLNNFYIYSTLPTDPFNFVKEYFPFAHDDRSPIIFTASSLFNTRVPLIPSKESLTPETFDYQFRLTSLKITCIIITVFRCYASLEAQERLKNIFESFMSEERNKLKKSFDFCYREFSRQIINDSSSREEGYNFLGPVHEADRKDLISYFTFLKSNYPQSEDIFKEFSKTFGVPYDIFR